MIIKKQARKKEEVQPQVEQIETATIMPEEAPVIETIQEPVSVPIKAAPTQEELAVEAFDIDKIDFSQRQERRRGDRRRGYRRIDDRNLISRAQEEAEQIKESAAKEGYRAGLEEAKQDIQNLRDAIMTFTTGKREVFEYIAPDILEIAIDIARKIIKKEVEQDPQIVIQTILDALENISKEETKITVRVNPIQADLVRTELPEVLSQKGSEARINIIADENVQQGGCVFNTANGIIDANIETQVEILKEALKGI